jgi:hypothetical protein
VASQWFETSYRRNLIDMHIPDWDEAFLSRFDPQRYVDMLELAQIDTAYVYTTSCLGLCYWPTKLGKMHAGLKGRDIVGEIFSLCHKRGINVIAYYNHWSRWACETHPDWQIRSIDGRGTLDFLWTPGHYGVCCPNSPYRDYVVGQIQDLCSRYDFAGMWFDMGNWPYVVCYCRHCRERYAQQIGEEMPTTVAWNDPAWQTFVNVRNQWLVEYTELITRTAKTCKPGISVGHQSAAWVCGWQGGLTHEYIALSDYLGGDFYGALSDHSLACKLLANLTANKPFEFMTSRCPDLAEHTTVKPVEQIRTELFLTLAHNGAFFFIDAIDPVGTLDRRVYEQMGRLYGQVKLYEPFLDAENVLVEDVGAYFNFESLINPDEDGKKITEECKPIPGVTEMARLSQTLIHGHIPFGWISDKNLNTLARHRVVLIPDFVRLSKREMQALTAYVSDGGTLIVFRGKAMLGPMGDPNVRTMISSLLGIDYLGQTPNTATYLAPTEAGTPLFPDHSSNYPLAVYGSHSKVATTDTTQTLATIVLPYRDGSDPTRFSSAISDPPWQHTALPAVVEHKLGRGRTLFVSGTLEQGKYSVQRDTVIRLIRRLAGSMTLETDAPKAVELTVLYHAENNRYTVNLVNCQETLPAVPVPPMTVRLNVGSADRTKGTPQVTVKSIPDGSIVPHTIDGNVVQFTTDSLGTFLMYWVELT